MTRSRSEAPIAVRFAAFHADNPHVYDELVMLARRARRAGNDKLGIKQLFEVLRWRRMLATRDGSTPEFKLNNVYTAPYARLIMQREPDLAGCFETRRSVVDQVRDA
jgi:hypothetical protein